MRLRRPTYALSRFVHSVVYAWDAKVGWKHLLSFCVGFSFFWSYSFPNRDLELLLPILLFLLLLKFLLSLFVTPTRRICLLESLYFSTEGADLFTFFFWSLPLAGLLHYLILILRHSNEGLNSEISGAIYMAIMLLDHVSVEGFIRKNCRPQSLCKWGAYH